MQSWPCYRDRSLAMSLFAILGPGLERCFIDIGFGERGDERFGELAVGDERDVHIDGFTTRKEAIERFPLAHGDIYDEIEYTALEEAEHRLRALARAFCYL